MIREGQAEKGGGGQRGVVSVTRPVILQQEVGEDPSSSSLIQLATRGRTDRFDVGKY